MHLSPIQRCLQYGNSSSVSRLPTEILTEIFCLSCAPNETYNVEPRKTSLVYPTGRTALLLSLVCSRWRSVALCLPKLWSFINVTICNDCEFPPVSSVEDLDEIGFRQTRPICETVKLYLERSRNLPLAVTVECQRTIRTFLCAQTPCIVLLKEVLDSLVEDCHRWRTARIKIPRFSKVATRVRDFMLDVPLLEVLDISSGPYSIGFTNTDRLHTLAVTATSSGHSLYNGTLFSAPSLRSLTLRKHTNSDLQRILSELGDTHDLRVHFERCRLLDSTRNEYNVPAIKSLSITIDYSVPSPLGSICRCLTVEKVTNLELVYLPTEKGDTEGCWLWGGNFLPNSVLGMVRRSSMPLKILKIDGFNIVIPLLAEILKHLPTIEEFSLAERRVQWDSSQVKEVGLGDRARALEEDARNTLLKSQVARHASISMSVLLQYLTIPSTQSAQSESIRILPNLQSVNFTFRPQFHPQDLVDMLYSRMRFRERSEGNVSSLKSVAVSLILDGTGRLDCVEEYRGKLKELEVAGLDVQYRVIVSSPARLCGGTLQAFMN